MKVYQTRKKGGMMLAETLLSLSVVSITIPMLLAVMSLSLRLKQSSVHETKLAQIAQYVFSELPYAWDERQSVIFSNDVPYDYPEIGGELHLLFTESAELYDVDGKLEVGDSDWQLSFPDIPQINLAVSSGYVVTVRRGYKSDLPERDGLKQFEVEISYPAGRPMSSRRTYTYSRFLRK